MMEIITQIVIFLAGSMTGALLLLFAFYLISKRAEPVQDPRSDVIYERTDTPSESESTADSTWKTKNVFHAIPAVFTKNKVLTGIVLLLNGSGWLYAAVTSGYSLRTAQFIIILSTVMIISIIDINTRIIPNALILFLLLFSLLLSVFGAENQSFLLHLLGLAVTGVLFCIPLLLTKTVGSGDIKYLAVMGFCLGFPDAIKAIMLFSAILLVWLVILLISKKGGLQTKLALGPFISIGFVATLLF